MMSPRRISRYGKKWSYQWPRPPKMNLFTSRWSPTSSVGSIDWDGILKAWTINVVPNSARMTVTRSDSMYSRSVAAGGASTRFPAAPCTSATCAVSVMLLFTSLSFDAQLIEGGYGCRLFGFLLGLACSGGSQFTGDAHFDAESFLVVPRAILCRAFGNARAVGQGLPEPSGITEFMSEDRLQLRKLAHCDRHTMLDRKSTRL